MKRESANSFTLPSGMQSVLLSLRPSLMMIGIPENYFVIEKLLTDSPFWPFKMFHIGACAGGNYRTI